MPSRLLADRFDSDIDDSTAIADSAFTEPEAVGIRWSLENFGTQRIEVTVRARNKYDAYDRYNNHLSQRIAVYSHWVRRPISAFVTEVARAGANRVLYIAKGPIERMMTEYDQNIYANTLAIGGASGAIATALSNMATRVDDTTTGNIASNATTITGYSPKFPEGEFPADVIKAILSMSDASFNIYDFWLVDQVFDGTSLQKWTPHYQARDSTSDPDWQVSLHDLGNITFSRNIDETVTDARIYYARHTGTHDGGNNAATLTDSGEDFLSEGITPGDSITNITDGSRGQVEAVTATTITPTGLTGGADNDFDSGDFYNVDIKNAINVQTATTAAEYWEKQFTSFENQFNSTQASQFASSILQAAAEQVQAFTITAPTILDGDGARWPLWEVIAQGGGYIRVNDLFPDFSMLSNSLNNLTTFFITALDYDYASNTLRVAVDNTDRRLDARLRRLKILNSELINRGAQSE